MFSLPDTDQAKEFAAKIRSIVRFLRSSPKETIANARFGFGAYPAGAAAKVLALYPVSNYASPQFAWNRVGMDSAIPPDSVSSA